MYDELCFIYDGMVYGDTKTLAYPRFFFTCSASSFLLNRLQKQNKTKQNKKQKQNKTKQNKTKQNKTKTRTKQKSHISQIKHC